MPLRKLEELLDKDQINEGRWALGPGHEIQYKSKGSDATIFLKANLISADPDALVVAVKENQSSGKSTSTSIRIRGIWRANSKNQLTFEIENKNAKADVLTFQSEWTVDEHNQIIYRYSKTQLKTKQKNVQEITFSGHWDLSRKNALVYWLGAGSDSVFRFRTAFQTRSILAKEGEIRYQLGVEINGRARKKTITMFGKWVLSRDLDVFFELDGPRFFSKAVRFGGSFRLGKNEQIEVVIKSLEGKPLGLEIIFTKDFLKKDAQLFVSLLKNQEEMRLESGVRLVW